MDTDISSHLSRVYYEARGFARIHADSRPAFIDVYLIKKWNVWLIINTVWRLLHFDGKTVANIHQTDSTLVFCTVHTASRALRKEWIACSGARLFIVHVMYWIGAQAGRFNHKPPFEFWFGNKPNMFSVRPHMQAFLTNFAQKWMWNRLRWLS